MDLYNIYTTFHGEKVWLGNYIVEGKGHWVKCNKSAYSFKMNKANQILRNLRKYNPDWNFHRVKESVDESKINRN